MDSAQTVSRTLSCLKSCFLEKAAALGNVDRTCIVRRWGGLLTLQVDWRLHPLDGSFQHILFSFAEEFSQR